MEEVRAEEEAQRAYVPWCSPLVSCHAGRGSLGVPRAAAALLCVLLALFYFCPLVLTPSFLSTQADTTHPLTKHRKIASSFRDSSLFDIFTLSCNLLKQVRKPSFGVSWGL